MKNWGLAAILALMLGACSDPVTGDLPEDAVEVTENRVTNYIGSDGRKYNLRTYTVPSQESYYYITVQPGGRSLAFEEGARRASSTASTYIRNRSCPTNLSRLSSRDVYDSATKTWLIVVSC